MKNIAYFPDEKRNRIFDRLYKDLDQATRAKNPDKLIHDTALRLLSNLVAMLLSSENKQICVDHEFISEITKRGTDQNVNLLKQIGDFIQFTYYKSIIFEDRRKLCSYLIEFTKDGEERALHPDRFYAKPSRKSSVIRTKKFGLLAEKIRPAYIDNREEKILKDSYIATQSEISKNETEGSKKPDIEKNIIKFPQKKLIDFYPLDEVDVGTIQSITGRPFIANAMNEILKDIARKYPDYTFARKQSFIRCFAKFISKEKRDPEKVNNENFRITKNLSENAQKLLEEDKKREKRSSYLEKRNPCEVTEIYKEKVLPLASVLEKAGIKLDSKIITTNQPPIPKRNSCEETRNNKLLKEQWREDMELEQEKGSNIWDKFLAELTESIGEPVVNNWFGEKGGKKEENLFENKIVFNVDSPFRFDWIKNNLESNLARLARKMDLTVVIQCKNSLYKPDIMIINEKAA